MSKIRGLIRFCLAKCNLSNILVMLTGGATQDTPAFEWSGHPSGPTANRILTTLQLYKKFNLPILISGGQVFSDSGNEALISKQNLIALGIPENKIIIDDTSRNTTENAQNTKIILKKYGFKHPILITSAFHMERSVQNFKKLNVDVTPCPTDYMVNQHQTLYPIQLLIPVTLINIRTNPCFHQNHFLH